MRTDQRSALKAAAIGLALTAAACLPQQNPRAPDPPATAPAPTPSKAWRNADGEDAAALYWRNGAEQLALVCDAARAKIKVSAALALPGPPPPGMVGALWLDGRAQPAPVALSRIEGYVGAVEVVADEDHLRSLAGAKTIGVEIAGQKVTTSGEPGGAIADFVQRCRARMAMTKAP